MYNKDNLNRFITYQNRVYSDVLKELKAGRKESHWIWYIFPQLEGLGLSDMSAFFGIEGVEEAKEYWNNDTLRERYLECCDIILNLKETDPRIIMGSYTDAMKLKSSLTLFLEVTGDSTLKAVLDKLYGGEKDEITLRLLRE